MTQNFRQRLLATTLLVSAGLVAAPAAAQTAPTTPNSEGTASNTTNPTGPVEAQPTPTTNANGKPVEQAADIVVTGTRIPSANLTSVAPVTTVTSQDIKLQGVTKIEDLLNSLPQVFAGQASTLSNGADGTATVDLRDLGPQRTLVLVNGRRLVPGDPNPGSSSAADLNVIPSSLVKRVEILTGGASATYGADAVAGVVNFIMDTNFTGIRFDGQYSLFQHNNRNKITPPILDARTNAGFSGYGYPKHSVADGGTFDGTVSLGTGFNDNRGHAVVYFGYRKALPITQDRRDYSSCTIQNRNPSGSNPNPLQCGGSSTSANGNALIYTTGSPSSSTFYTLGAGTLTQPRTRYNFAPTNYFQRNDERYTAGLFANYEISPAIKPYLEFMFMDDRTTAQIAPSGDFFNTNTLNCDNPLLSAQQSGLICNKVNLITGFIGTTPLVQGTNPDPTAPPIVRIDPITGRPYNLAAFTLGRRNVEGGPRQDDLQHTSFRGVLGTRGDLNKAFSYDAYYQYGRTNYQEVYSNEFSQRRLVNALDVVANPTGGAPVCRSVLTGADPNCVPYDVFTGRPISAAALNYVAATGFKRGQTTEQVASASVTGKLGEYGFKSPYADEGIGINVGAEYRREGLDLKTDNEFSTGDLTGQGAPTLPINGSYHVAEGFAETSVPLVRNNFIDDLTFTGGYRYSKYTISNGRKFTTNTYKLGLEFAPVKDLRFRGGYNRAVRVPNIQELFATQFVGLDGVTDPCAGHAITNTSADAGCRAQGLRVGQNVTVNPAAQYNGLLGGNPALNPETATTKTFGVVLQPRFIPRFALTVDYFDIKVKNAVQGFGADAILTACNGATPNLLACSLIKRNSVTGSLFLGPDGFVSDLKRNIGSVRTRGIEVNSSYNRRLGGLGSISASLVGTYLDKLTTENGLTEKYDCVGYYGPTCGTPAPKWRHKARLTLQTPMGIGISGQWRFFGPVNVDYKNPSATTKGPFLDFGSHLKSQSYFDLATTFAVGRHYNLRLGVNNIMDKQPPLVTSGKAGVSSACPGATCNGNTFPAVYDALGRYLYAGITLDF